MRFGHALIALLLGGVGCSREKGQDCTKLAQAAGPQHAAMTAAFGRSDQNPDALEAEATGFEKGAADLKALELKDENVKGLATDFAAVLTKAATIRRDQAKAGGALDPTAAAKAQADATSFIIEETRVKARIDTTCR